MNRSYYNSAQSPKVKYSAAYSTGRELIGKSDEFSPNLFWDAVLSLFVFPLIRKVIK